MSSSQANNIKQQIEQTMMSISGLLKVANDQLKQAHEMAKDDKQKAEFAAEFVKSGIAKEFENINEKLAEFNNGSKNY